jgi:hypothetical protein
MRSGVHPVLRVLALLLLTVALGRATYHALVFTEQIVRLAKGAIR